MTLRFLSLPSFLSISILLKRKKPKSSKESSTREHEHDYLLCKFVTDGSGKTIGESVSIIEDIVIIKSGYRFLGVPLKHVEDRGKTLLVKGLVDYDKALEMGERWRKESFREINHNHPKEGTSNEM
jgi:hypothetical protein